MFESFGDLQMLTTNHLMFLMVISENIDSDSLVWKIFMVSRGNPFLAYLIKPPSFFVPQG